MSMEWRSRISPFPAVRAWFVVVATMMMHFTGTYVTDSDILWDVHVCATPITQPSRDVRARPLHAVRSKMSWMEVKITMLTMFCDGTKHLAVAI